MLHDTELLVIEKMILEMESLEKSVRGIAAAGGVSALRAAPFQLSPTEEEKTC